MISCGDREPRRTDATGMPESMRARPQRPSPPGADQAGGCRRAGVPGIARAMVMLFTGDRIQDAWSELEYCVRTGEPVFRKRGLDDPFGDAARNPEEAANFDAAMADFTKLAAIAVAAA